MKTFLAIAGVVGSIVRVIGWIWAVLWALITAAVLYGDIVYSQGGSEVLRSLQKGLPQVLSGAVAIWLGNRVLSFAAKGRPASASGGGTLSAAGQAVLAVLLLFFGGVGWMFISSVLHNRGYAEDRGYIKTGVDADTVLAHIRYADRVNVDWAPAAGAVAPESYYRRPVKGIKRPVGPTGVPAGIVGLTAEYQIFAFSRKFIDVTFDETCRVSDVRYHSLD